MGFKFRAQGKKAWSKEYDAGELRKALMTRLRSHDAPFHLRERDEDWGPWRSRVDARDRLAGAAEHADVGTVFEIENEKGWLLRLRRTGDGLDTIMPPWSRTYLQSTNPRINRVAAAAYAFDEGVDCLGTKVCKRISGTTTWSEHAYGNAIDLCFRVPPPTGFDMARQQRLADFLVAHADELALEHVIHKDQAWTRGYGWAHFSGEFHTHVHADATPQGVGWPPGC